MHEEFVSHRLQSSTFSPSVWARVTDRMNSTFCQSYVFTQEQLKGKLNRMRRAWRLLNDLLPKGTGWGWDHERNTVTDESGRLEELYWENSEYKKIVEHGIPRFDLCTQMFARNTAFGGIARSSTQPPTGFQTGVVGDDEQMTGANSGSRRSREDYEDTTFSQSQPMSTPDGYFTNTPTQSFTSPSSSKRPTRRKMSELHSKKCETMDKLNESLQGKIDRTSQKATESIEHCVDELTKFKDLPDFVFTTALERFHSHSIRTIFLRLDDENKLRWLYSLAKTMASDSEVAANDTNSSSGSSGTPENPGNNESNISEEFYSFRDLICPKLFREKVPRNTSALQGEGWVAKMMATPHTGRFYNNIRMTKPCFYALVDALTSRGLLPHGQTSRVSSIEEVALFMQTVGMHKRQRDNMERFRHSLETIHCRFHRVLSALCAMAPELITRPNFTDTHPRVSSNTDFYPYFKNVLAICDVDMNFTYVYAGWEGNAADAHVLNHAVSQDPAFPFPPIGKYYLVDAEFTNYQCFLAPYRGTRYHLAEYRRNGRRYRTPQDLFNHAHSRLRNVIDRCFGVLKKRFPILQWGMPSYLLQHQVDLVIACCTLHNFIRRFSHDDTIFNAPEDDIPPDMDAFYHRGHPTVTEIEAQRTLRDNIAMQIYLKRFGFPQEDHWTLSVEQRLMWMIVDDNTRDSMRDDHRAEAYMTRWARGLRRHFGYHHTLEQVRQKFYELKERFRQFHEITQIQGIYYDIETFCMEFPSELRPHTSRLYPLARRYFQYPEPNYPSMLEIWGPIRLPPIPVEE
ncbi:UNVERIFIED_CONTAM: hypothetical protein Sradi_3158100 [Sesamum radiatum]|uniref:Uncharacterized protein n=1 Tax=Sesamum radiatum TaxID=300843 RepID=A0AAW2RFY9_SESRA